MLGNKLEFLVMLLYIFLFCALGSAENGVSLLVISELCWVTLYGAYTVVGIYLDSYTAIAITLPILVLASVDAGIWVLVLVYFNYYSRAAAVDSAAIAKFMFRVKRLLQSNRFIK